MTLNSAEKYDWIRLALSENVGPITFRDLINCFKTPASALERIADFARRGGRTRPIKIAPTGMVDALLARATTLNASIITYQEEAYSTLLKQTEDKPPLLFILGNNALLNKSSVSMVGSRNASINGQNLTRKLAFELASHDYVVVSGMARGIDTAAHTGALKASGGGTIAVLGTGIDIAYPAENKDLYNEIKERGCLVSELPFGTGPIARNFPRRNRIISGLSRATVVIEAQLSSGSLITAREALSQNREVMAVPGAPADPRSEGPNQLLKDGAILVRNVDDIIDPIEAFPLEKKLDFQLTEHRLGKSFSTDILANNEAEIEQAQQIILKRLTPEVTSVDSLIQETDLPVEFVNVVLSQLELAGRIERSPGNKVSLIYGNEG